MRRHLIAPALVLAAVAAEARAHFPWIRLEPAADRAASARVVFNELPEVGEPDLSAKVAGMAFQADGRPLAAPAPADGGGLRVDLGDRSPAVVEGTIDYGVLTRGGQPPYLLVYSARAQARPENAPASRPDLALVWTASGDRHVVRATWRGEPLADASVRVLPDEAEEAEVRTDADGRATLPPTAKGATALLIKHVEPRAGEHGGERFEAVRHYATLTIAGAPAAPSADAVLQAAHDARACWGPNFPGFGAAIRVDFGDATTRGTIDVAPDGTLTLDLPDGPARDWARAQLRSLVMHRGLDGPTTLDPGAAFVEPEGTDHPLGRLIRLADDQMGSHYRIAGDEIREVNRDAGPLRFSNRVLAVTRNAEGKVLPGSYTVTYRDRATDALVRVETFHDTWTRVGRLDLPATHTQILAAAEAKAPEVRRLVLTDHRPKPTAEAASR
jgi:hypothetical protein